MKLWKCCAIAVSGLMLLSQSLGMAPASAKPKKDRNNQTIFVVPAGSSLPSVTRSSTQMITFSSSQRTILYELLRGSNTTLIPRTTLVQIADQRGSLPPGIQKQLLRGKGLPPGIAKKILLSREVVTYLDLPPTYNLYVIGSNVVLLNTVTGLIADCLPNIL